MASYLTLDKHQAEFVKLLQANSYRHSRSEVFRDFCEMSAIALSNRVDLICYEQREARYMTIIGKYTPEEVKRFPEMFQHIFCSLTENISDCMGTLFMHLELGDAKKGQFFTPYPLSKMIASVSLNDVQQIIDERGHFTVAEPACGAGGMIVAAADYMQSIGVDYSNLMHVTGFDIDETAVHMAYLQWSILDIPARIYHGSALNPSAYWAVWYTPSHVLGGWSLKLRRGDITNAQPQPLSDSNAETAAPANARPAPSPLLLTNPVEQLSLFG